MFPFVGFYFLYLFRLDCSERLLTLLRGIKLKILSVQNKIFSRRKTKEKWIWKSHITTYYGRDLRLSLYEVIVTVLLDDDWGLFEHALLAHFTGSDTDDRTEVLFFFLFKSYFCSEIWYFVLGSQICVDYFEWWLVFKSLKVNNFSFNCAYVLSINAVNFPFNSIWISKLDFVWNFQIHHFWEIINIFV